jgi:hypothetical protein
MRYFPINDSPFLASVDHSGSIFSFYSIRNMSKDGGKDFFLNLSSFLLPLWFANNLKTWIGKACVGFSGRR